MTGEVIDQERQIIGKPTDSRETLDWQTTDRRDKLQSNQQTQKRQVTSQKICSRETGERWKYRSKGTGDRQTYRSKRDRWQINTDSKETDDRQIYRSWRDRWQLNTDSRETGDSWKRIQATQVTVERRFKRDRWELNTDSRETDDSWTQIQERQVTGERLTYCTWNISGEDNSKLRSSAETYFLWRSIKATNWAINSTGYLLLIIFNLLWSACTLNATLQNRILRSRCNITVDSTVYHWLSADQLADTVLDTLGMLTLLPFFSIYEPCQCLHNCNLRHFLPPFYLLFILIFH